MTAELYINNTLVDLDQNSIVALSFAVNTLNELKTLNGNISNRITLPNTALNRRVLGFVGDTNIVLDNTIRKKLLCKYVQNGVEVIPEGVVNVGTSTKKGVGVVITSGNVDFFDLIDGSIRTLGLSAYDHPFDWTIIDSRLNRTGYIYPVVNYGDMTDATAYMNVSTMRPATFISTVVNQIVKETGFTLINELEINPRTSYQYSRLILPFANDTFEHSQRGIDINNQYALTVRQSVDKSYQVGTGVAYANLTFDTTVNDPSNSFLSGRVAYQAPARFTADIQVTLPSITVSNTVPASAPIAIDLVSENTDTGTVTVLATNTLKQVGASNPAQYTNIVVKKSGYAFKVGGINEKIYVRCNIGETGNTITFTPHAPVTMTITPAASVITFSDGSMVQLEATLPDISKKDFLKAVANLFGAIVQTDNQNKTVQIVPFFKIVENIPLYVDWSNRIVNLDDEANEVSIGDYTQVNLATYKNDDAVTPDTYGGGSFAVADQNLDLSSTAIELPFSASYDSTVMSGIPAVLITKIADGGGNDMTISTEPRLVMVDYITTPVSWRKDGSDSYTLTYSDSIPKTFFIGAGTDKGVSLQQLLTYYYGDIITMLNDQRKKTIPMFLKEPDISALNFFKPIYLRQYAAFFYLSKITDYVGERPCTVELIKLY